MIFYYFKKGRSWPISSPWVNYYKYKYKYIYVSYSLQVTIIIKIKMTDVISLNEI